MRPTPQGPRAPSPPTVVQPRAHSPRVPCETQVTVGGEPSHCWASSMALGEGVHVPPQDPLRHRSGPHVASLVHDAPKADGRHALATHCSPAPQARPQAPQWSVFRSGRTHSPEQLVSSLEKHSHRPVRHSEPGRQRWPHAPQFELSLLVSRQRGPSAVEHTLPPRQAQAPMTQVSASTPLLAPRQATPHPPQFAGSAAASTQRSPQRSPLPGQRHAPSTQAVAAPEQRRPQAPQFSESVRGSTQRPPQKDRPVGQLQAPSRQSLAVGQRVPHCPQFSRSVRRSAHGAFGQEVRPGGHWHAPPTQALPAPHSVPHAPQFAASARRSTQCELQFTWDGVQLQVFPAQVPPSSPPELAERRQRVPARLSTRPSQSSSRLLQYSNAPANVKMSASSQSSPPHERGG